MAEDPELYNGFLKVFTEIYGISAQDRSYEARLSLIRAEMKDKIFKDYPDLLEGFESFVPKLEPACDEVEQAKTSKEHRNMEGGVEKPT